MNATRKPPRHVVSLSLSAEELAAIDEAAYRMRTTRSAFLREATLRATRRVLRKLDGEPLAA